MDALLFQEKPAQRQVQLFSHLPQFERDKTLSRTLEYVATHNKIISANFGHIVIMQFCRWYSSCHCEARTAVL